MRDPLGWSKAWDIKERLQERGIDLKQFYPDLTFRKILRKTGLFEICKPFPRVFLCKLKTFGKVVWQMQPSAVDPAAGGAGSPGDDWVGAPAKKEKQNRVAAASKGWSEHAMMLWKFVHDDSEEWRHEGNKRVGREGKREREHGLGRTEGYITAWRPLSNGSEQYRMVYVDGTTEDLSRMETQAATRFKGVGLTTITHGFSIEFTLREARRRKHEALRHASGHADPLGKATTSQVTEKQNSGSSYTTSITTYDVAWDKRSGEFEHRKILGIRELNEQTGLSAHVTEENFPELSAIFSREPLTEVQMKFSDAAPVDGHAGTREQADQSSDGDVAGKSGVREDGAAQDTFVVMTAIAHNRRPWMQKGGAGEFSHG
eukprot:2877836-Rhodomonas_salina.1